MRINKGSQQLIAFVFGVVFTSVLLILAIFFPNPTGFQFIVFRIVLALAAAGVAAMIPGILEVELSNWIKAGGALSVFIITYFYNPAQLFVLEPEKNVLIPENASVTLNLPNASIIPDLPDAKVILSDPQRVDFRTKSGPELSEEKRLTDTVVITVPFHYKSIVQPSKTATIEWEKINVKFPNKEINFLWERFVKQHEENYGKWLGIEDSVSLLDLDPGKNISHETLFRPSEPIPWHTFADLLKSVKGKYLSIELIAQVSGEKLIAQCNADMEFFQSKLANYGKDNFMRVTLPCDVVK